MRWLGEEVLRLPDVCGRSRPSVLLAAVASLHMADQDPERLIELIGDALTSDARQYSEVLLVELDGDVGAVTARVALVRRCGRAAGRRHGVPVRTLVSGPDPEVTVVHVLNMTPIDPDDRLAVLRLQKAMRAAINSL